MSGLNRRTFLAFGVISVVMCAFLGLNYLVLPGSELELAEEMRAENISVRVSSEVKSYGFGLFSSKTYHVSGVELLSDTRGARGWPVSQSLLDAIQKCRRISSLRMSGVPSVDSRFIQNCQSLPYFITLDLSGTRIDDSILPHLATSESLQNLRLLDCDISDEGLSQLADLKTLRVLSVRNSEVTGRFLHSLSENDSLYSVALYGESIDPSHLAALTNSPVERIAITCKPSDLPREALLQSKIKGIEVSYEFDLDQQDREMIAALASPETGRHVLLIRPDRKDPEWGRSAALHGSR